MNNLEKENARLKTIVAEIEKEKLINDEKLANPTAPHRDFKEMLEFPFTFRANPWNLFAF